MNRTAIIAGVLCAWMSAPLWALQTVDVTGWVGPGQSSAWPTGQTSNDLAVTGSTGTKKLIYYGWSSPDNTYIRNNWQTLDQLPFSGIGFYVLPGGANFGANILTTQSFPDSDIQSVVSDLQSAHWKKMTDNFITVLLSIPSGTGNDGGFSWFDDTQWAVYEKHFQQLAVMSKQGGCKGIIIDPEQYTDDYAFSIFDYAENAALNNNNQSLQAYQAMARQRGQEVMTQIKQIYPNITILTFSGYESTLLDPGDAVLYAPFLDGMLEAAAPGFTLVDGYESAYGYKQDAQYAAAKNMIRTQAIQASSDPALYNQYVKTGFGFYLDERDGWNGAPTWDWVNLNNNYYSPSSAGNTLKMALDESDQYVWVYSEITGVTQMGNWPQTPPPPTSTDPYALGPMPQPYLDAMAGDATPQVSVSSPAVVVAGSPGFTLQVLGSDFVSGSTVCWNGIPRATTFVSTSQLSASIPASDVQSQGTFQISVVNPYSDPSVGLSITVVSPPIVYTQTFSTPFQTPISLTLSGTDPNNLGLTFSTATLPMHGTLSGTAPLLTYTPATNYVGFDSFTFVGSNGYATSISTPIFITITTPPTGPPPGLSALNPSIMTAGDPGFSLTINGTNLESGCTIYWNGTPLPSQTISANQATALVQASLFGSISNPSIQAINPDGGISNLLSFSIVPPPQTPDLSGWDLVIPVNGTLNLSQQPNSSYQWIFNPDTAESASISYTNDSGASQAQTIKTSVPTLGLAGRNLVPGRYSVQIIVTNAAGKSAAPAQKIVTLTPMALSTVRVYPNPFRSARGDSQMTFDQMPSGSTVKIFTVSGRLVKTLSAPDSMVPWDLTNDSGEKVASGIYLYLITDDTGNKTHGKFTVIR